MKISILHYKLIVVILLGVTFYYINHYLNRPMVNSHIDITEDLHHRLLAGIFDVTTESYIIECPFRNNEIPILRDFDKRDYIDFNWEKGGFSVQMNKDSQVIVYLNHDTVYGHIKITARQNLIARNFYEYYK